MTGTTSDLPRDSRQNEIQSNVCQKTEKERNGKNEKKENKKDKIQHCCDLSSLLMLKIIATINFYFEA